MTPITRKRTGEDGWALVSAVALMSIMLIIGLATMANVDFNSDMTRENREAESSLNLTEGVLYAQAFTLARNWPAATTLSSTASLDGAFPPSCSSAAATTGKCPNRDNLSAANSAAPANAAFNSTDYVADGSWTTRVRDNYGQLATSYDINFAGDAVTLTNGTVSCPRIPCTFDFNDDKAMWVESRSVVRGEPRRVVALMKLETIQESVPRIGIATGALQLTNNGAASYDVNGASATVNCNPDPPSPSSKGTCTNYKSASQVSPAPTRGTGRNFMTPEMIERFKDRAMIDKTYYDGTSTCPPDRPSCTPACPPLDGAVVFIEKLEALNCDYKGTNYVTKSAPCNPAPPSSSGMQNPCVNQNTKPGLLIVRCGGYKASGNWTYVGVVYFVNGSDGRCPAGHVRGTDPAACPTGGGTDSTVIYSATGGAGIWGALAVDGNACTQLGSNSQLQVLFNPNVFNSVSSYGTVGLVQNTWRELPPGT